MSSSESWSFVKRLGFRFAFAYFVVYDCLEVPGSILPGVGSLWPDVSKVLRQAMASLGNKLLHPATPIVVGDGHSGDSIVNYVTLACVVALALTAAIVWSLLDRRAAAYPKLYDFLRTALRFNLAFLMLSYGMSKVVKLQFPAPSLTVLTAPLGETPPMGLLWTFMGASRGYTFFAGASEVAGGLLLYFRRTTTLGALVVCGVMSNVVMLNFCYDVPVKLFSTHIFCASAWLAWPDARQLFHFFVRGRAASPAVEAPWFAASRVRKLAPYVQAILIAYAIYVNIAFTIAMAKQYGDDDTPKHALYGIYDVASFSIDGEAVDPLLTDERRFRQMIIERSGGAFARRMNGTELGFKIDEKEHTFSVPAGGPENTLAYKWSTTDQQLELDGKLAGDHVTIKFKRVDPETLPLLGRRFRWVIE